MNPDYSNSYMAKEGLKASISETFSTLLDGSFNAPDPKKRDCFKQITFVYNNSNYSAALESVLKNSDINKNSDLDNVMQAYDTIAKAETLNIMLGTNADEWIKQQRALPKYSRHILLNNIVKHNDYLKNCENKPVYTHLLEKSMEYLSKKSTIDKGLLIYDVVLTNPADYNNMKSFVNAIERKVGTYSAVLELSDLNSNSLGELVLEDDYNKDNGELNVAGGLKGYKFRIEESKEDECDDDEDSELLDAFENGVDTSERPSEIKFRMFAEYNSIPLEARQIAEHHPTIESFMIENRDSLFVACKLIEGFRYHHD